MSSPRISVVMPVRDSGAYVREAVESVLGLTFDDFEVLAIDVASTDDSPAFLNGLLSQVRRALAAG